MHCVTSQVLSALSRPRRTAVPTLHNGEEETEVTETEIYYEITDEFSTRDRPAGVLRRIRDDGRHRDEAFGRNLAWGPAADRYPGDPPADKSGELTEITREVAERIIARMLRAASRER